MMHYIFLNITYCVFKSSELGFIGALTAAILIWQNKGNNTIPKPVETENGDFAISKPSDEYMQGVQYDLISSNIKIK